MHGHMMLKKEKKGGGERATKPSYFDVCQGLVARYLIRNDQLPAYYIPLNFLKFVCVFPFQMDQQ